MTIKEKNASFFLHKENMEKYIFIAFSLYSSISSKKKVELFLLKMHIFLRAKVLLQECCNQQIIVIRDAKRMCRKRRSAKILHFSPKFRVDLSGYEISPYTYFFPRFFLLFFSSSFTFREVLEYIMKTLPLLSHTAIFVAMELSQIAPTFFFSLLYLSRVWDVISWLSGRI